ncbi:MAG: M20/M25/M40 family metallo-hydrolase [Holophagaceae bacterium]|nr:M20/M25/M40 family metallo-hydrolase [Holophagaceae bacterium]
MRPAPFLATGLCAVAPLGAQAARQPAVEALAAQVEAARLQATVAKLVAFGTRHTLSDTVSETRGIGAARRWLAAEFAGLAAAKDSRLTPFTDRFTAEAGPRVPKATELVNTGAVLPGTDPARAKEALVLTGHYDSRASDALDGVADAPGAVDDGSGTALVLELARVMARERPAITIYFVAVAGEEQGLLGSAHLAARLKEEGVSVLAMVSVDIAGNTEGQDGVKDNVTARLFSEGVPTVESEAQKRLREAVGGENDGGAREWARYVKRVGERYAENLDFWLMLRRDRLARGSDHTAFSRVGVPAIRLSETHEHYDRQHQDVRVKDGRAYGDDLAHFDAAYTAKLGRALLAAYWHLSHAPAPPRALSLGGAVSPDTKLRWTLPEDPRLQGLVLYRRRADAVQWQRILRVPRGTELTLPGVVPDNEVFALATVGADGSESLPAYPTKLE